MKVIDLVAGARPNFVKIASITRAMDARIEEGGRLRYRLVHTGQHYDQRMSADFFAQLGIREPDVNLEVGSGTQAEQTANIMLRYEALMMKARSDLCLVVGDVTSTMACALVARKMGVRVAHVEAGIRSNDWAMPEEINRVVTDAVTNYFFTTSRTANEALARSGASDKSIFFVGNTMIDTLLHHAHRLQAPPLWQELQLRSKEYFLVTLHRPANVDFSNKLAETLECVAASTRGMPVVFPVHPRTARSLIEIRASPSNIHFVDPQPYLEFIFLAKNAKAVITDSGGITEETTVMGVPCITLRDSTERPETVVVGTNELIGTDPKRLTVALDRIFAGAWKKGGIPELWDGNAGSRIVKILEELV